MAFKPCLWPRNRVSPDRYPQHCVLRQLSTEVNRYDFRKESSLPPDSQLVDYLALKEWES
jgi:hypothetical protein